MENCRGYIFVRDGRGEEAEGAGGGTLNPEIVTPPDPAVVVPGRSGLMSRTDSRFQPGRWSNSGSDRPRPPPLYQNSTTSLPVPAQQNVDLRLAPRVSPFDWSGSSRGPEIGQGLRRRFSNYQMPTDGTFVPQA
jgi:hypothetical protein